MSNARPRALARPARRSVLAVAVTLGLLMVASPALHGAQADTPAERYAAIVVDADSGEVLFARHADDERYPASITKVMTLYLVFQALENGRLKPDDRITVSARAASRPPSKLGLPAGSRLTVDAAIRALAVRSSNDVAVALAEEIGGTESGFAAMMTAQARKLGMRHTRYVTANGLPDPRQTSSARDTAILSLAIRRDFPQYYSYFGQRRWTYQGHGYNNTNGLLHTMPGVDGIKTGYTRASGYNLVASARRDGHRVIAVVLGGRSSQTRNSHVAGLIEDGFRAQRVLASGGTLAESRAVFDAPSDPARRIALPTATPADAGRAPPAPVRVPGPEDERPVWRAQVGAFRDAALADAWLGDISRRFREQFADAEGEIVRNAGGWRQVRYGAFTRPRAAAACAALEARGVSCLVVGPVPPAGS